MIRIGRIDTDFTGITYPCQSVSSVQSVFNAFHGLELAQVWLSFLGNQEVN
jgi:hypothetical protein